MEKGCRRIFSSTRITRCYEACNRRGKIIFDSSFMRHFLWLSRLWFIVWLLNESHKFLFRVHIELQSSHVFSLSATCFVFSPYSLFENNLCLIFSFIKIRMAATLKPYLNCVRSTLTAALCIQNFDSQVIFYELWRQNYEIIIWKSNSYF